jgi:hypothetical protein
VPVIAGAPDSRGGREGPRQIALTDQQKIHSQKFPAKRRARRMFAKKMKPPLTPARARTARIAQRLPGGLARLLRRCLDPAHPARHAARGSRARLCVSRPRLHRPQRTRCRRPRDPASARRINSERVWNESALSERHNRQERCGEIIGPRMNGAPTNQPEPPDGATPGPLDLSGPRAELHAVLAGKQEAAGLYRGALRVLADGHNPVAARLTAGALRELLDDLQRYAGYTRKEPSLKQRVIALEEQWSVARASVAGDERARGFGQTLDDFFAKFRTDYPRQREQAAGTLAALDPARGDPPPPAVAQRLEAEWMSFRDYFNNVLHGNVPASATEVRPRLERLEALLLARLRPKPSKDLVQLDQLIDEGPPNG